MTQRSNHSPSRTTATAVAKAVAARHPLDANRIDIRIVNVALAALILVVVVLITTPPGAG